LRLTELGRLVGLVDDARWVRFESRRESIARLGEKLTATRLAGTSLFQILGRPETTWEDLCRLDPSLGMQDIPPDVVTQVVIGAKYGGYIGRQKEQIERFRRLEDKPIPPALDYRAIPQLRVEAREKFERIRPTSLGQAGRIAGISPSDIATLLIHLKKQAPSMSLRSTTG
jgi:tRNA uridine 5-carboxymethylaminomethyl modification enzyme